MAAVCLGGSLKANAETGQLVRLSDGRHLYLDCTGHGSPTIVLEGGFAATSQAWFKVQPILAQSSRTCSYDRAGYGLSDPGPMPRDGRAVAQDLNNALRQARIGGPFVVVGHSAGALYLRIFADLRPHDVVGMVLADPSIEHQDKRFAAYFGSRAGSLALLRDQALRCLAAAQRGALPSTAPELSGCTEHPVSPLPATSLRPDIWRTQVSELDTMWGATSDEVAAGRPTYGDMPLIVLTADGTYSGAPAVARLALNALWWQLHGELAARSTRGSSRLIERTSHMMMFDRPDAIISAVQEIVSQIREKDRKQLGQRD